MAKQGLFIVLYGVNNIGKSTQAAMLAKRIKQELGQYSHVMKYPVSDLEPSGPMIEDYLRNRSQVWSVYPEEVQSLYALNRLQYQPQLKKLLKNGVNVIAEDYTFTGVAWGMVYGQKQRKLEYLNSMLREEDLCIFLQGQAFTRGRESQHRHESQNELMLKATEIFDQLAREHYWHIIPANQTPELVHEQIWQLVSKKMAILQS